MRKALQCPVCMLPARRDRRYAPFCSLTCAIDYAKAAYALRCQDVSEDEETPG